MQATLEQVQAWEHEGSLPASDFPATIQDSMSVCRELGYRYLWVDRLCIPQDAYEVKRHQINAMDKIYAFSHLTIVAASGQGARDGLAGVSHPRKHHHIILNWEGLELKAPFPTVQEILSTSKWNTRGWTFQEGICASNLLYLTEYGAFADLEEKEKGSNSCCIFSERKYDRDQSLRTFRSWDYYDCVMEYTTRVLTHSTDILNAFAGVINMLEPSIGKRCEYGLPLEMFDQAILWRPVNGDTEPRHSTVPGEFPSWSWCCIQGAVMYQRRVWGDSICGSLASWAFSSTTSTSNVNSLTPARFVPFRMKAQISTYGSSKIQEWMRGQTISNEFAMSIAWDAGFFMKKYFTSKPIHAHEKILSERNSLYEQSKCSNEDLVQHAKDSQPRFLETFTSHDRKKTAAREGRILVLTQSAWFKLEYIDKLHQGHAFLIRSSDGLLSGTIWLTQHIAELHVHAAIAGGHQCMEFLALSITLTNKIILETATMFRSKIWHRETIHGRGRQLWTDIPEMLNADNRGQPPLRVMLIIRHDGVARRLGIGQIYMTEWKEASPKFCITVLE